MQIADMATPMFCPCCQSVVPIIQQNAVRTHEEVKQLMQDWQLVERLMRMQVKVLLLLAVVRQQWLQSQGGS